MSSASVRATEVVVYCLRQSLKNAQCTKYGGGIAQTSYSIWAAKEILKQLRKYNDTPPLIVIENFRNLMDEYSCKNRRNSYLFSCAKDMAEWIIDLLIA
jgi:hypothetical protein